MNSYFNIIKQREKKERAKDLVAWVLILALQVLKGIRICYPKICYFVIRIILS